MPRHLIIRFMIAIFLLLSPACAARSRAVVVDDIDGGDYRAVHDDGAWCWFADPRAITVGEFTYVGAVSSTGDIVVSQLNHATHENRTATLHKGLDKDDHANPSLIALPEGRIRAYYSKHSDNVMRTRITMRPHDVSEWSTETQLALNNPGELRTGHPNAICYPNPALIKHNYILTLFWRGTNWKPCLAISTDGGASFSTSQVMFDAPGRGSSNRPYLKSVCSDGEIIHIAITTGHPRNEPNNSIYYCAFDGVHFRRADGTIIGYVTDLPIDPESLDCVYDASTTGARGWIWDIAATKDGRPVIAYTRHPHETRHVYHRAEWRDGQWCDAPIVDAGPWFPDTPVGKIEPEPHYSAGICLDHHDPRIAYISRPVHGVFEIEQWRTDDHGASWDHTPITTNSTADNVRPVAVRSPSPAGPKVCWMHLDSHYEHYTRYRTTIRTNIAEPGATTPLTSAAILSRMESVGRWQLEHPSTHQLWDWTHGALYTGMMALAGASDDPAFENALLEIGRTNDWKPGPRALFADDHCVGQLYLELYERHHDPDMLAPIQQAMDHVIAQSADESLEWVNTVHAREWAWCDALFMAPATLTRLYRVTGDERYLHELDRRWWKTTDYLYDESERLYFRDSRYFDQRESNGEKVFWSRGNGWVIAGLARVLQDLPADWPTRSRYESLFRSMAERIASLQQPDGLWRSSLLDPDSYPNPETSGSGFFCFALAWGVNEKLLDEACFRPVIDRAWAGLNQCVNANGRLGFVQPVGQDPRTVREYDTEVYGVGAFLLAGEQMRIMITTDIN